MNYDIKELGFDLSIRVKKEENYYNIIIGIEGDVNGIKTAREKHFQFDELPTDFQELVSESMKEFLSQFNE